MKHALLDHSLLACPKCLTGILRSAGTAAMGADELPVRSPDSDIELSSLTAQGKEAGEKTCRCLCSMQAWHAHMWRNQQRGLGTCLFEYDIAVSIWDGFCEEGAMPVPSFSCAGHDLGTWVPQG